MTKENDGLFRAIDKRASGLLFLQGHVNKEQTLGAFIGEFSNHGSMYSALNARSM